MPTTAGQHTFSVTDSQLLHAGAITALRRDTVLMPGGTQAARDVIEHFGAVAIVVVDDDGRVALVRQYRHPVAQRLWELPAGLLDIPTESAVECAQRELWEEAALGAHRWDTLADIVTSPGIMDEAVRIFLARELYQRPAPEAVDEEADAQLQWFSLDEAVAMIGGDIVNAITITGLLLAQRALNGAPTQAADADFPLRPTRLAERRGSTGQQ